MNVSLTPELEKLVKEKVSTGRYSSGSEVVREALRLLEERDRARQVRLEQLKREVALGVEQADRGEVSPLDIEEVKAEGRRRLAGRQRRD